MFEDNGIQTGQVAKRDFEEQEDQLRVDLVNAQFDLDKADFSVVIIIVGDDRIGANHLGNRLNEWMDARYIDTNIFLQRSIEEAERPRFWRYWKVLPAAGRIGVFGGAWPLNAVSDRLKKNISNKDFAQRLEQIKTFEQELADDGTLVLKFWIHLPEAQLKKRLKKADKDPDRSWWTDDHDWDVFDKIRDASKAIKQMLETTHTVAAPWHVIDGSDGNFRDLTVAGIIRDALQTRLNNPPQPIASERKKEEFPDLLAKVDLSQSLAKDDYKKQLAKYQRRFHQLMLDAHNKKITTVLAFEGWDAGGKGGNIRRLTNAIPARSYKVVSIAAPTDEEHKRHYLWRFWRYLPRAGNAIIFDRTWYGRVTVERIEGFAAPHEWQRAYREINDFEQQLVDRGMVVLKFWLHISPEEQLARFQAREKTPYKKYKITDEDYRNRGKWDDYVEAVNEMVAKTDTKGAPWHLVPANDKRFARIYVLKTVCAALEKAVKRGPGSD
jgi:polyphosphate:AMP phosphotransferase